MPVTKKVLVTIEKEIELTIPDYFLSESFKAEYGAMMYGFDASTKDIIEDIARLVAQDIGHLNNDGFGRMIPKHMVKYTDLNVDESIIFDETWENYDVDEQQ